MWSSARTFARRSAGRIRREVSADGAGLGKTLITVKVKQADDHGSRAGREQRLPAHAVVGRSAAGLGQHQHEQERDQDRPGVDDHRGHGQELRPLEEEQAGRAQQRHPNQMAE